jgi:NADH:ubiquinone oxidoreductase subunit H
VQVQKLVMAAVGLLCLLVAAILGGAAMMQAGPVRAGILGAFWFLAKVFAYIYAFMWFRFTFPRYRFDQLMRLGWQFLIPVSIINVMALGLGLVLHRQMGWTLWPALLLMSLIVLLIAAWFATAGERRPREAEEGA